jgi:hypothetical protein
VRLALDGLFDTAESPVAASPAPRPLWRRALPVAGAAMVTALAAVAVAWRLWPAVVPAREVRFEIATPA